MTIIPPFLAYEKLSTKSQQLLADSFATHYGDGFKGVVEEDQDYDFVIQKGTLQIKVQHTFADGSEDDRNFELKRNARSDGYTGSNSSMTTDKRIANAIKRKEKHYSHPEDIILLLQYDLFPNDLEFFKDKIFEIVNKSKFKSIWIYSAYALNFKCLKKG